MLFYPTCACTLKLKDRIIACDSSHLALAVIEYDHTYILKGLQYNSITEPKCRLCCPLTNYSTSSLGHRLSNFLFVFQQHA